MKRTRSIEEFLLWLYLRGISTGDFVETLKHFCWGWMHKTANVLEKLSKAMQPKVKEALHNIWQAKTREKAYEAFDNCITRFNPKYPKAMECVAKDKDSVLAFYDYPAENWQHIRTTNPVESVFATVRG